MLNFWAMNAEQDQSNHEPTDRQVNRHAVSEGLKVSMSLGLGTLWLGVEASESIIGEETIEELEQNPGNVNAGEAAVMAAPILGAAAIGAATYKWISNKVRRNRGSGFIGYQAESR